MRSRPTLHAGLLSALLLVLPVLTLPARADIVPTPIPAPSAGERTGTIVGGDRLAARGVQLQLAPGVPAPPAPKASAWLIADLDTRQVLAARNAHLPLAPASTLKIFTALALAPTLDPTTVYTARFGDAAVDGTRVGLVPGSRYTVDDLLHGMVMGSGNDCAHALGNLAGGQVAATGRMKAVADRLGAFDTVPVTTSGLDAPGQVSSAYDLALAGSAALADPQLAKIMRTTDYRFPAAGKSLGAGRKRFATQNHNHLLRNVRGATGVKNGYTVAARGSFVGSATRAGHSYLVVLLRAEGNTWRASADLLDWAFAHGSRPGLVGSVGELVRPGTAGVLSAASTGDGDGSGDAAGDGSGTGGVSHLSGARIADADGTVSAVTSLQTRLDRAGLDGQLIMLTSAAALTAGMLGGLLRLQLSRRRRALVRRARHHH